jgi:orotate phosphoribosyltransferase
MDDVASTGKSLVEAYEKVMATGATVVAVISLVDRAGRTQAGFAALAVPYLPLVTYNDLGLPPLGRVLVE